ncbi:hypothetical protein [Geodermatophilus sp. CPCC 205506]|uniref:hypothetical protein n=1 Tax=Geodermatophilus sp. CPCC 205506 TaxID=2936596 RepID=UPI003EE945D4
MTTTPDVQASRTRLSRAARQLNEYHNLIEQHMRDGEPYAVEVENPHPLTGEGHVYLKLKPLGHEIPAVLADFLSSLRIALDYSVRALAELSGTAPTPSHQFPIETDRKTLFSRHLTPDGAARPKGWLQGLTHGLGVIESNQPFNLAPDDPRADPLALLQRFSNTAKHREPITHYIISHGRSTLEIEPKQNLLPATLDFAGLAFARGERAHACTFRYTYPFPDNVRAQVGLNLEVLIVDPELERKHPRGALTELSTLDSMYHRVATIINLIASVTI